MSLACAQCPVRDRAACAVLDETERGELGRIGRMVDLAPGEVLFRAGDEAPACATLVEGALKIVDTTAEGFEHILGLIHPAGFVGEFFQPFARHEVVALTRSRLCVFGGHDMERAIERYPALARALLRRAQTDVLASRDLLSLTSSPSAKRKVAGLLLAFADAASDSPCHPAAAFDLPLSRGEMAAMLGLTIETVSRRITAMERDGILSRTGKRGIALHDPARLSGLAERS
ncbi:Crp/Fnr family transcriptional regulator [Qipengyuania sp. JC766]|uniref:Crp/Fnr family transcriptional regulator n=1 Tax=Qipengyuania sp. JC766 TaxID=3232139 RepID=UPI00345753F8